MMMKITVKVTTREIAAVTILVIAEVNTLVIARVIIPVIVGVIIPVTVVAIILAIAAIQVIVDKAGTRVTVDKVAIPEDIVKGVAVPMAVEAAGILVGVVVVEANILLEVVIPVVVDDISLTWCPSTRVMKAVWGPTHQPVIILAIQNILIDPGVMTRKVAHMFLVVQEVKTVAVDIVVVVAVDTVINLPHNVARTIPQTKWRKTMTRAPCRGLGLPKVAQKVKTAAIMIIVKAIIPEVAVAATIAEVEVRDIANGVTGVAVAEAKVNPERVIKVIIAMRNPPMIRNCHENDKTLNGCCSWGLILQWWKKCTLLNE